MRKTKDFFDWRNYNHSLPWWTGATFSFIHFVFVYWCCWRARWIGAAFPICGTRRDRNFDGFVNFSRTAMPCCFFYNMCMCVCVWVDDDMMIEENSRRTRRDDSFLTMAAATATSRWWWVRRRRCNDDDDDSSREEWTERCAQYCIIAAAAKPLNECMRHVLQFLLFK